MTLKLSGPMFEPSEDKFRRSVSNKSGGHYNIFGSKSADTAIDFLRLVFGAEGKANEFNLCVFSTSGVHGSYTTLEEIEATAAKFGWGFTVEEEADYPEDFHGYDVTFLMIQPRIVSMTYGNALVRNSDDLALLKALRASSAAEFAKIGNPTP